MKYIIKQINHKQKQSRLFVRVITTTWIISLFVPVAVLSGSISEGYPSSNQFTEGSLVSILSAQPTTIELANVNNSDYLAGVVVESGDSLININQNGNELQVATSGEVYAFVSDINGDIEAGDFIATSWISGVGMKSRAERASEQKLLGIALTDFNSDTAGAKLFNGIETPDGTKPASIGKIAIKLFDREVGPDNEAPKSGIEILATKLAGKQVAFIRVLVASGLFGISVIISGVFLANAIRGSFISLGRNPLASASIFSSLMQVSGTSIGLVLLGAFISYILLII